MLLIALRNQSCSFSLENDMWGIIGRNFIFQYRIYLIMRNLRKMRLICIHQIQLDNPCNYLLFALAYSIRNWESYVFHMCCQWTKDHGPCELKKTSAAHWHESLVEMLDSFLKVTFFMLSPLYFGFVLRVPHHTAPALLLLLWNVTSYYPNNVMLQGRFARYFFCCRWIDSSHSWWIGIFQVQFLTSMFL